ncbi:hypothetical protein [Pedobacter caeni]|uniref:Uncharacterized protein n=1 Tax=Pedobacter caeni TaxID=288992 RepID=A0A1M5F5S6_9SPHI|nr:hypothetical protein [Pedobacter caeni]SHF86960.1 hypothetical protein SAMN04488522_103950 [Pedobacter caeni]
MHNYKNPIYEIEVKTQGCPVELQVNDMPCFISSDPGGMAVDWPVNPNIMSSGRQRYSLKAHPYSGDEFISKRATLDLKVYVRDAFDNPVPRQLLAEIPTVDFSVKDDSQVHVIAGHFDAEVPYMLEGWAESVSLIDDDKDVLMKEIESFYDELYQVFKSKDLSRYKELSGPRFQEMCTSFYIGKEGQQRQEARLIPNFKGQILRDPFHSYRPEFYVSGKVVGVALPGKPCGFHFYSTDKEENSVLELALFRRKKKGGKLSLVR